MVDGGAMGRDAKTTHRRNPWRGVKRASGDSGVTVVQSSVVHGGDLGGESKGKRKTTRCKSAKSLSETRAALLQHKSRRAHSMQQGRGFWCSNCSCVHTARASKNVSVWRRVVDAKPQRRTTI
jgi:hypothetical protein